MVKSKGMHRRSYIVGLLASLALFGCSGAKHEVKAPETNPWADYKGTFAAGGSGAESTAEATPASTAEAKAASSAKPKNAAEAKPKSTAEAKPTSVAAPKPDGTATDARAMYGVASDTNADEAAPQPTTKKTPKKRGAIAGKKAGAKKAPATR